MLTSLQLERFKSFEAAELALGPLTVIVGTNASGKSNLRDAFRFLHGIGRGYMLADIIGERYGQGGELQWRGIRGGTREIAFNGASTFAVRVFFTVKDQGIDRQVDYGIEVDVGNSERAPRVISEHLIVEGYDDAVYETSPEYIQVDLSHINIRTGLFDATLPSQQPILSQAADPERKLAALRSSQPMLQTCLEVFSNMRFVDLNPEAMRRPSIPGQRILGDQGENLSSVLQIICKDSRLKATLIQWIKELTPLDAIDFEFPTDQIGRILVTLVESNGRRTTAYSASDGTLRFLGMLAALLGPEVASFYFFEEVENGIHPSRLYLLMQLIQQQVAQGGLQVVVSTHSPQLLRLVSPATLEHASVTYRLADRLDARISRILDIEAAAHVNGEQDLARLHESGWLEDAVEFLDTENSM